MSMPRRAALQAGLLMLVAMFANAASRNTIRIKVLDSETRSVSSDDNNGVPLNCDELTFDAYCRSTRNATATLVNTVLVQEGNGTPFRITCTDESRGSKCIHLPIGETFDARKEKHGITVYYLDDKGKGQSQLYSLVAGTAKAKPAAVAMVPVAKAPASAAPAENRAPVPTPSTAPVPAASVSLTAAPVQNSSATAPAPEPAPAQGGLPEKGLSEKVRCNFARHRPVRTSP